MSQTVVNPYRYVASENCDNFDSDGGVDGKALGGSGGTRQRSGIEVQAGNPAIGKVNPTIKFWLNNGGGDPTGDAQIMVYQGDVQYKTGSTIDPTTLVATPNFEAYPFTISDYTISASDRIVLVWTPAGGTDPQINVRTSNIASYDAAYNNKAAEWKTSGGWTISSVNSWWCYG